MNYQQKDWLGSWQNFENYLVSTAPAMQACWTQAEEAAKALPMFPGGRKNVLAAGVRHGTGRPRTGWLAGSKLPTPRTCASPGWMLPVSRWTAPVYHFTGALEKGLEEKVCAKFETAGALQHPQFRCLLAMPPMPERTARAHGGLLSHLHFQYAAGWTALVGTDGKLSHPMWYPTMCDGAGTLLEQCNIVRAMHHLTCWTELPV